ncbi:MAG: glycosyltransferase family 2 protein [bacterium]
MKVSVIIPTYNRAGTIKRAVKSVLVQDVKEIEIIICDDNSTDNTKEIVDNFIKKDSRVKFIKSEKNSGLPAVPRNKGAKIAKGEWLAFLDSDDEWLPDKLEKQLTLVEKEKTLAICTNAYKIKPNGEKTIFHTNHQNNRINFKKELRDNWIINSSVLVKKNVFDSCGGFSEEKELKAMEDYNLWLKILTNTNFTYIDEPLLNYYDNPNQSIRGISIDSYKNNISRKIEVFKNLYNWLLPQENKTEYKLLSKRTELKLSSQLLFHNFKQIIKKLIKKDVVVNKIKEFYNFLYLKTKETEFYNTPAVKCFKINYKDEELKNKEVLDIGSIAFNNAEVIEYQIKLIKKNIKDKYSYTIFDNSTDKETSEKIFNLCKEHDIPYLKLPNNPLTRSASHGASMNWIYRNYFSKRKSKYFGFIDHDIFPIRPASITNFLKTQPIWGHYQERQNLWYLWGNFCFFNANIIKEIPNFLSGTAQGILVDTGGLNWKNIYSKIDKDKLSFPRHYYENIREGNDPHSDMIEYIGDWLHLFNSSNWKEIQNKEDRDIKIKKIMNKILNS